MIAGMRAVLVVVVAVAGCGRFGFDSSATGDGGDPTGDGAHDAPTGDGPPAEIVAHAIGTGWLTSCAIRPDRTIACWGDGRDGELGIPGATEVARPVTVVGLAGAIALGVGDEHACAIVDDGTVHCWGNNDYQQLGSAGPSTSVAKRVLLPAAATALAIGGEHACARLVDRSAYCWGSNDQGQTGLVPTKFTNPNHVLDDVSMLAAGADFTCAVKSDRSVWCWGQDAQHELGDGAVTSRNTPQPIAGFSADTVACGLRHACALDGGHYRCWGDDTDGQLGDNQTNVVVGTPTSPSSIGGLVAISAGAAHTCAVGSDGTAYCWGLSDDGAVGDGTITTRVHAMAVGSGFAAISAGLAHTCAVRPDLSAACWGYGSAGQLGNGMLAEWSAKKVPLPNRATKLALGASHVCAVDVANNLYCWGDDASGQVGANTGAPAVASPALVQTGQIRAVALGVEHTCSLLLGGLIWCWGDNHLGQFGDASTMPSAIPRMATTITNATNLAAGEDFTCVSAGVTTLCAGNNDSAQLGNNTSDTLAHSTFTSMGLNSGAVITAGTAHVCGQFGQLMSCWGEDYDGEIGIGADMHFAGPAQLPSSFSSVAAGGFHTCALDAQQHVLCWGQNADGQVGNGTFVEQSSMVDLGFIAQQVAAGASHSCALTGSVATCWGANDVGALGNGTPSTSAVPQAVALPNVSLIQGGDGFTCALDTNGAVWCWGDNARGQIGQGTFSRSLVPVAVQF